MPKPDEIDFYRQCNIILAGIPHYLSPMITNYTEFWDFYVSEHSKPLTRELHFVGTSLGMVLLAWFIWSGRWYYFPLFLVVGYAFAWFAHFVIERNRPATFKYPFWSFISDFKMMWYMITGRMEREFRRVSERI